MNNADIIKGIIFDFNDGSTLQIACETLSAQVDLLKGDFFSIFLSAFNYFKTITKILFIVLKQAHHIHNLESLPL